MKLEYEREYQVNYTEEDQNNVSYVKFIINTLSSEFIDRYQTTDFEIHYIDESKEGQNIKNI